MFLLLSHKNIQITTKNFDKPFVVSVNEFLIHILKNNVPLHNYVNI